jgi:hypothetical protein
MAVHDLGAFRVRVQREAMATRGDPAQALIDAIQQFSGALDALNLAVQREDVKAELRALSKKIEAAAE